MLRKFSFYLLIKQFIKTEIFKSARIIIEIKDMIFI